MSGEIAKRPTGGTYIIKYPKRTISNRRVESHLKYCYYQPVHCRSSSVAERSPEEAGVECSIHSSGTSERSECSCRRERANCFARDRELNAGACSFQQERTRGDDQPEPSGGRGERRDQELLRHIGYFCGYKNDVSLFC